MRSLAEKHVKTYLINDKVLSLSRFSRYLTRYYFVRRHSLKHLYTPESDQYLADFIMDVIPEGHRWAVFGVNEDITEFLFKNRATLDKKLLIPENNISPIIDKFLFAKVIEEMGLYSPKTFLLKGFVESLLNGTEYICKGRTGNKFRNISNSKGFHVSGSDDILKLRNYVKGSLDENEVILQEKVKNNKDVLSCCGFSVEGDILRSFQYVKIRQHPDEFGTGTFLKSIKNQELFDQSILIINHLRYTGIYEIEYIKNPAGHYYVIEMNPRTWKSINFASNCGQNICAAYYDYIVSGITPNRCVEYDVGKTWVDLGTDIPVLFKNRLAKNAGYDKNTFFCVLDRKDPLPFIMEILLAPFLALSI